MRKYCDKPINKLMNAEMQKYFSGIVIFECLRAKYNER
jgi:hypothetical protein